MSIEFEIEHDNVVLALDAYSTEAIVTLTDHDDGEDSGVGATYTADQLRRLRRFLEYAYPASEDPGHAPDSWEALSGGVPNSGTTTVIVPPVDMIVNGTRITGSTGEAIGQLADLAWEQLRRENAEAGQQRHGGDAGLTRMLEGKPGGEE